MDTPRRDPRRLPAGRHGIPLEEVRASQHDRLTRAMADACAEGGYANVSVDRLVARAAVSKRTFYQLFETKRDCLLAAHRRFAAELVQRVAAACAEQSTAEARVAAALTAVLQMLSIDLPVTRLLCIEVLAADLEGTESFQALVETLVARLRDGAQLASSPKAARAALVFIAFQVGSLAVRGDQEAIRALEQDFATVITALLTE